MSLNTYMVNPPNQWTAHKRDREGMYARWVGADSSNSEREGLQDSNKACYGVFSEMVDDPLTA